MTKERLQKVLARAGIGSRRACERLIEDGRVTVDDHRAQIGERANPQTQDIRVDGKPIPKPQPKLYLMLHKPRGPITTTHDPRGRTTVMDLVDIPTSETGGRPIRLYPVGRLDADSEGLLLLTNDGRLTHHLTHPSFEHDRVYRVRVLGYPEDETLDRWREGIVLDGRRSRFDRVEIVSRKGEHTWLRVTLHEGRKHIVRRIVAAMGHPADRLIRVRMGPLKLGDLPAGEWRYLREGELRALQQEVGIQGSVSDRSTGTG